MKITVLGSASGMAVPHRNASAYHLQVHGRFYLFDAGEGLAQQLVRHHIDQNRIDRIFISHTHPDHASGLLGLLQLMYLKGRQDPLAIYLPKGVLPGFESIFPYFHIFQETWPFPFKLLPISPGIVYQDDTFQLSSIRTGHLKDHRLMTQKRGMDWDSYSFQFNEKNEHGIIYTSDVDDLNHLHLKSGEIQLLIAECTHIQIEDIIKFARSLDIKRIIITHIPPETDKDASANPKQKSDTTVKFAYDGMVIEV